MDVLSVACLGPLHIRLGEKSLTGFTTRKALALLVYLVATPGVHTRDTLANLLWSDMPEQQAKKNLRNALPNLRVLVGSHLLITRHSVAFNRASPYRLDVEEFCASVRAPATPATLHNALSLYRDDFLRDFFVRDAPAFEEWALIEREHLRTIALDGFQLLATQCIAQHNVELGLQTTQRLLALDTWRETAHQQHMILLAYSGQRHAALSQYEACRALLDRELGVEPMAETTALYEQIKAGAFPSTATLTPLLAQHTRGPGPQVDWDGFPIRTTVYGRHTELASLQQWLAEGVGLVGIFGLGGQGKTALAAHLAWSLTEEGSATSSPRLGVEGPEVTHILWRSLAHATPFTTLLHGCLTWLTDQPVPTLPTLVDEQCALFVGQLRQRRCLLILDNLECLLHDGEWRPGYEAYGQLLQQLAQSVHQSCLLCLSRERPRLFNILELSSATVRSLPLRGVAAADGEALLRTWGLQASRDALLALLARYDGHPLALRLVAASVHAFFAGDLAAFVATDPRLFEELSCLLAQQCATLQPLEHQVLCALATPRQPATFQALWNRLGQAPSQHALLEALRGLQRRSLFDITAQGFGVQSIVAEYVQSTPPP